MFTSAVRFVLLCYTHLAYAYLESMTSHQNSDSVNQCVLLEQQSEQISFRSDLK